MISIETLRTHRHSRAAILADPDILLIRRGYRVRLHGDQDARPWEIWQSINIARLHALDYQSSQRLVFTGNSALLLHGSQHGRPTPVSRRGQVSLISSSVPILQYSTDTRSCPVFPSFAETKLLRASRRSTASKPNHRLKPSFVLPSTSNPATLSSQHAW